MSRAEEAAELRAGSRLQQRGVDHQLQVGVLRDEEGGVLEYQPAHVRMRVLLAALAPGLDPVLGPPAAELRARIRELSHEGRKRTSRGAPARRSMAKSASLPARAAPLAPEPKSNA